MTSHIQVLDGHPTPEELAAVVVALTPVAAAPPATAESAATAVPAWTRAALLEGVGGGPAVASPADLGRRPA